MINIREEDLIELRKEINDVDNLLKDEYIGELMSKIDDLVVYYLGEDYELTPKSRKYQDIFDRVYADNFDD